MADFCVIITGSREDSVDADVVHRELAALLAEHGERLTICVGDCKTGVDAIARAWCKANGVYYLVFEADWDRHGPKAGPIRNGDMIRSGADVCLAFNAGGRPFHLQPAPHLRRRRTLCPIDLHRRIRPRADHPQPIRGRPRRGS